MTFRRVVVALFVAVLATNAPARPVDATSVTGRVELVVDGGSVPLPAGHTLQFGTDGVCGTGVTSVGGMFEVELPPDCVGAPVSVSLMDVKALTGTFEVATEGDGLVTLEAAETSSIVFVVVRGDEVAEHVGAVVEVLGGGASCAAANIKDTGSAWLDVAACRAAAEEHVLRIGGETGLELPLALPQLGTVMQAEVGRTFDRNGTATVRVGPDGAPTPVAGGLTVDIAVDGQSCGAGTVDDSGALTITLDEPCTRDGSAVATLASVDELATEVNLAAERLTLDFIAPQGQVFIMGQARSEQIVLSEGTLTFTSRSEVDCGSATVGLQGSYLVLLDAACQPDEEVTVSLSNDGSSSALITLPRPTAPARVDITLTAVAGDDVDESGVVREDRPEAILDEESLVEILRLVIITMAGVLLALVVARYLGFRSRVKLLEKLDWKTIAKPEGNSVKEVLDGQLPETETKISRTMVEAIVLGAVTISLVILMVSGTMSDRGAVSLFGAILGYTAGRTSS